MCLNHSVPFICHILKSRVISFVQKINFNCQIVLKIGTEHGDDIVVLRAIGRNDWTTKQ